MTIQTLIKQAQRSGLVIIPRREYDELLGLKKSMPTFKPTEKELKIITRGEREFIQGKFKPWSEVKHELERHYRKRRAKRA
ncbi:MAG: hypothetical protein AAB410_03830 [Patescibacteria group bacterium]